MVRSSKVCKDPEQFQKVFTEGPLQVLINHYDATTTANLVGSSKHILQSAKESGTVPFSHPFGLPCVLHYHPTVSPWESKDCFEVAGNTGKLTLLDRFSSDAVMPNGFDEQRAGVNGDWMVTVGLDFMWDLVNVYTHRKIVIPQVSSFEPIEGSSLTFQDDADEVRHTKLQKLVICQVLTAARGYKDFSLVAIFEFKIAVIKGNDSHGWSVCVNEFQGYFRYCDAIIQHDRVFVVTENGCVYAWKSLELGPTLILSPRDVMYLAHGFVEDDEENDLGRWWLARTAGGSRLLLVYTYGVSGNAIANDTSVVHYGRTVHTYPSGLEFMVFLMDTSQLTAANRWKMVTDLGSYSVFLGVNYPIIIAVGDANDPLGHLTRRNYVYTSHQEIGYKYRPRPEICRFSLNSDAAVGFHTNTPWTWSDTPFWFIPSFSNALEWNEPIQGYLIWSRPSIELFLLAGF